MVSNVLALVVDREGLGAALMDFIGSKPRKLKLEDVIDAQIPSRGGILIGWDDSGRDRLADLLIVRDEDLTDTLAWVSSFLSPVTPLTQWCRVLPASQIDRILGRVSSNTRSVPLSSWIGAIYAECSVQAEGSINLREVPATATVSSATFAAARASVIYGASASFRDLARRYDELSARLRETVRPLPAAKMLPLWYTLAESSIWPGADADRRVLEPFVSMVRIVRERALPRIDTFEAYIAPVTDAFDLPELMACCSGPQSSRVEALDALIRRVNGGPNSATKEALIGLGASLIDPGASVMPDLLRKHGTRMPLAPLWLGAFGGLWDPIRVLSDHQGLGRLTAKALLAPDDIKSKPSCDVAYEELQRWLGSSVPARVPVRGMAARSLMVEIEVGVTCAFATGRAEAAKQENPSQVANRRPADLSNTTRSLHGDATRHTGFEQSRVDLALANLVSRIEKLESAVFAEKDLFQSTERDEGGDGTDAQNKGRKRSSKAR